MLFTVNFYFEKKGLICFGLKMRIKILLFSMLWQVQK